MLPAKTAYYKLEILPGSEDLLIVFPSFTESEGWFGSNAQRGKATTSRLYYSNMRPEWVNGGIPALIDSVGEIVDELRALVAQSGAKRVYTFGFSFGAFGALLVGLALKAERVVAVSGQTALGLPGTRSARLLGGKLLEAPLSDLRALALQQPPKEVHLLYGERDTADLLSAVHMVGVPNVNIHFFRGTGHNLPRDLKKRASGADPFADLLSETTSFATHPDRLPIDLTPDQADMIRQGFTALGKADFRTAERLFRALSEALPQSAVALQHLGLALKGQRRWNAALEPLQAALEMDPRDPNTMSAIASLLARTGRGSEALAMCERGLAIMPVHRRLTRVRARIIASAKAARAAEQPAERAA